MGTVIKHSTVIKTHWKSLQEISTDDEDDDDDDVVETILKKSVA